MTTTLVPNFGSNRLNAERPGGLLAGCEWIGVPFMGGCSEVRHMTGRTIVCNDAHADLINLARIVADPVLGPKLYRRLRRVPFHAMALEAARADCASLHSPCPTDDDRLRFALAYFVSSWMGRNGKALTKEELKGGLSVRWDAGGGDSAVRFRNATKSLLDWRRVFARVTFTCMDAFTFLRRCQNKRGHGIYVDPPWPDDGDSYLHRFSEDDHICLAEFLTLQFTETKVVVRFGDHPLIRELYSPGHWHWLRVEGRTAANKTKPEVLLTNWEPEDDA